MKIRGFINEFAGTFLVSIGLVLMVGSMVMSSRISPYDQFVNLECLLMKIQLSIVGGALFISGLIVRMTRMLNKKVK